MSKSTITISTENNKIVTFDCVSKHTQDVIEELVNGINMTINNIEKVTPSDLASLSIEATIKQDPFKEILSTVLRCIILEEANTLTFTIDGKVHSTIDVSLLRCEEYKVLYSLADSIIKDDQPVDDFPVLSTTKS